MDTEVLGFFIGLAIVLAMIAVVGHGLWVFVAWIFRSLTGDAADTSQPCPHCGSRYGMRYGRCLNCGQTSQIVPGVGSVREELQTTLRQLSRLHDKEAISRQQHDELTTAIRAELASLYAPQQTPAAVVAAAVVPSASEAVLAEVVDAVLVEAPANEITGAALAGAPSSRGLAAQGPSHSEVARPSIPIPPPASPVHPLDRTYVPEPPKAPRQPGRAWAEVLQGFMEESNIRWGEIIAAILILVSSVGLVVSIQSTYKLPYFPALIFTLFTVAFHGAGMYTLRRWNLQAISRVILIISLLLVPLTFSGAVVLSGSGAEQRSAVDPMFLIVLAAGIGIFSWVSYSASRELVGRAAWPLSIGVLGCSLSQVLIQRVALADIDIWSLNALAGLPVGAFLIAAVGQVALARRWPRLSQERVTQILRVLGIATFALVAPLILLLARSDPKWLTLARLSPQLSIAAAAILALGLLVHKRTTARRLAAWQTVGTGIVVFAGALLLMLVVFAWPEPELLLAVGLINCLILAVLGVVAGLPLLYIPAVACAALAVTIGLHLAGGHFAIREQLPLKLVQAGLMGRTSLALTVLGVIVASLAGWLMSRKQRDDALLLLASTGGLAAIAIVVALFSGFVSVENWPQDRDLSAAMLFVYAAGLIVAALFIARDSTLVLPKYSGELLTGGGSLLLWTALVQALYANATTRGWLETLQLLPDRPVLIATLAHGVLTALLALVLAGRSAFASIADFLAFKESRRGKLVVDPLAIGAAISLVAIIPFVCGVPAGQFGTHAVLAIIAAAGWAILAAARRWPGAIAALQAMAALAPALAIIDAWNKTRPGAGWYESPEHWLVQLTTLAVGAAVWSAVRRLTSGREVLRELLDELKPSVDQVLLGAASIGLPIVALWLALPDIGWELGFHDIDAATPLIPPFSIGWLVLALVVFALAMSLWERVTFPALMGLGIATFAAVWLAADQLGPQIAAASAARWAAAIYAIIWGAAYIARDQLRGAAKQLPWLRWQRFDPQAGPWFCAQPLLFGGATILILTIIAVNQSFTGVTLRGPVPESILAKLGLTVSYAGPLLALVAVLLGYAIRERQAGFALGGWLVFQLAVNLAFLLHVDASTATAAIHTVECLQWNSLAAGAFALVWLGLARWITPPTADSQARDIADWLWRAPLGVAFATAAAIVVWAGVAIVDQPINPHPSLAIAGSWLSYACVLLVLAAVAWRLIESAKVDAVADAAVWLAAGMATLIAASLNQIDPGGQWLAYHALEVGWIVVGAVACGLVYRQAPRFAPHHLSAAMIAGLITLLAIRGNWRDWQQPWWSLAMTLGACGITTTLGLARRSQLYAYASTLLAGLAMVLYWAAPATWPWHFAIFGRNDHTVLAWFECVTLALLAAAGFWLWREIACQRKLDQSFDTHRYTPRAHALVLIGLLPLYGLLRLLVTLVGDGPQPWDACGIASLVTTLTFGGLLVAALWDRRATFSLPLLYLWGAAAWCLAIGLARVWLSDTEARVTALVLAAGVHVALTGQLWSYGANLSAIGAKIGVADPVSGLVRTARWLPVINLLVAAMVCVLDLLLVLNLNDLPLRVAAAFGPAVAAWGILCLAQERRRDALQLTALLAIGLSAVYLGWAQLDPFNTAELWLDRVFRLLMVLAALTFIYGLALPRFLLTAGSWNATTRKAGYIVGSAALVTFVATLVLEVALFVPGVGAPVAAPQVIAIAVVLVGLIAGLISLAVLPGRDPLVLSEKGRQGYVYAALATAALLFAHLYVCEPGWFDRGLSLYWPFIVMAIAFLGVGAAELFHRWRVTVLAEPLERTGALLPLLPVLGWWAADSAVDYSLLLFTVGLLYLALSYARKSWAAMIAAVVAGNSALWSLLSDTDGFEFAQNPQLWLIPPALSALVAAQLNRRRLTPEMLTGIRYAATVVIYISSTSQLFINGIGESLWPPMVLLALAVAGALLGIALRVRAFLFLGATFTLLALIGMVAHAARSIDDVWPWWVFGIVLGVAMLVLFGFFEKRKAEMLALIGRLRQWEQ